MDDQLVAKMKTFSAEHGDNIKVHFLNDRVEMICGDKTLTHQIKPLGELYGSGNGKPVKGSDMTFMPLMMGIEQEIISYDKDCTINDSQVILALNALSSCPEDSYEDDLTASLQTAIRIAVSMNNYSRQEVRQAIRQILKSVGRHENGRRGYIDFIATMLNTSSQKRFNPGGQ